MDGSADVTAHDMRTGAELWRANVMPKSKRNREAWGGGLAYADGKLYVSSGFREVVQLDARTGALGWRSPTEAPIHAAPTVSGGRVFVADVNDEMLAFDAATGRSDWTYQALTEPARILAASSSGGRQRHRWSPPSPRANSSRSAPPTATSCGTPASPSASRTNALSEIRDIAGRPVIFKDDVFAVSHSDVFAAVDLRTGVAALDPADLRHHHALAGGRRGLCRRSGRGGDLRLPRVRSGLLDPRSQRRGWQEASRDLVDARCWPRTG